MKKLELKAKDFNLGCTLECGQAFRWARDGEFYYGVVGNRFLKVSQKGDRLSIESSDSAVKEEELTSYFNLDLDLSKVVAQIDRDRHMHEAIKNHKGLRILRQDRWECLISYMLSAYNNIPRIKGLVENLSAKFGNRICLNGYAPLRYAGFSFPAPRVLKGAGIGGLKDIRMGFRASSVYEAASKVASNKLDLSSIAGKNYQNAKDILTELRGVGDKVADCVLLFGFGMYEAFPVDVWIRRVMEKIYFKGRAVSNKEIREFAQGYFGPYAGYAQEYLYAWGRAKR